MNKSKPSVPVVKPTRDKVKKSIKLAEKRISKALNVLRQVGNLASPNYKLSEEQVRAMFNAIENCTAEQQARFEQPYVQKLQGFTFDDYAEPETIVHDDDNL